MINIQRYYKEYSNKWIDTKEKLHHLPLGLHIWLARLLLEPVECWLKYTDSERNRKHPFGQFFCANSRSVKLLLSSWAASLHVSESSTTTSPFSEHNLSFAVRTYPKTRNLRLRIHTQTHNSMDQILIWNYEWYLPHWPAVALNVFISTTESKNVLIQNFILPLWTG